MNIIFSVIYAIFLAFIIDSVVYFILPDKKVYVDSSNIKNELNYKRFNIYYAYKEVKIKKVKPKPKITHNEYPFLQNITLQAILKIDKFSGYVIINQKGKSDSIFLNVGDSYKGFKLVELYDNYALFEKSNKKYKLELNKKVKFNYINASFDKKDDKILDKGDYKSIDKSLINSYIHNPRKIWSNISINEYRKNGKIIGFKVYNVKRGSDFEKIGLKAGDIIIKVNNIKLNSIKSAFDIYNKVKNGSLSSINLIILRNNQEMELEYEIE